MNAQNEREGHRGRLAAGAISGLVDLDPQFGMGLRNKEFLEARLTPLQKGQDYHKNREITEMEARARAGGRCWTIRGGDEQTETTGERQVATFDKGLYFNPGPARIPQYHVTLDYCKEFGVPVEVFVNANDSAYYYNENVGALSDQRIRVREARTDLRGHISELLAKAIEQQALDTALTAEDNERLLEFLLREGALSPEDLTYRGYLTGWMAGSLESARTVVTDLHERVLQEAE